MSSQLVTNGVAGTLGVLSAAHITWVFSSWPLPDRARFAEAVVGVGPDDAPSAPMTVGVAALLAQAAVLVKRCGAQAPALPPGRVVVLGTKVVAGVLLARAVAGLVLSGSRLVPAPEVYRRLDLTVYSPLCLLLGVGAATVASSARPAEH
ncbi:DUF3995 domain-containing protein [Sanguibacter sp. 25GB23B1]|uniref:DUF3995 domain-containing protein n=1 Tax=unclassified Sanguibacter TaxID=2645534 RepID=UPI0032AF2AFD